MRAFFWRFGASLALGLAVLSFNAVPAFPLASFSADSYLTDYSSTNVGTSSPVTLVTSVSLPVREVHIFDSSGVTMKLTITSGPYVTTYYIPPGGDNSTLKISKGDSITILSTSGTISSGINILTLLY
jgi:hypothetical protein